VIQRICALSIVVLIVLPFTAPFATFDLRELAGRRCPADVVDTITAPSPVDAQDDAPVWFERSELHHSMECVWFNSAASSSAVIFSSSPLVIPAAMLPSHTASALVAVLRV
jgi:hypothetical protein